MYYEYKGYEIGITQTTKDYIHRESITSNGEKAPKGYKHFKFLIRKDNINIVYDTILLKSMSETKEYCVAFIDKKLMR